MKLSDRWKLHDRPATVAILLAVVSAIAYAAALPNAVIPYGSPPAGLVALVPLYIALRIAPRMRTAMATGAVFGALSTVLANFWLGNFGEFAVWTLGGPTVGYTVYNTVLALVLRVQMRLRATFRPLAFAATWTGYELLKSIGYLGYPWGLAAYTFGGVLPMMQIADVTGVYGLSFLVVYANATIAELAITARRLWRARGKQLHSDRRAGGFIPRAECIRKVSAVRHAVVICVLIAATAAYGAFRLNSQPEPTDSLRALLVQQNTDSWEPDNLDHALSVLQRLSSEGNGREHDIVIWSENSLSRPYIEERDRYFARNPDPVSFSTFISQLDAPLLTGSPYLPPETTDIAWNAVILIEPGTGDVLERYGKRKLVPFAEHIPFWEVPAVRNFFQNVVGLRTPWTPADERVLFDLPTRDGTARAGVPISFEGAFASLTRDFTKGGADLIINMTNNSWSQSDSAQYQQFVVTRFRAIEARRPLAIATISGLTSVVDIGGAKLDSLPMFEEAALSTEVPLYDRSSLTAYHRIGDLFGRLMLFSAAISLLWATIRKEDEK